MSAVPPFTLRRADKADIPAIQALANTVWWAHYPGIIPDEDIRILLEKMYATHALQACMRDGQQFYVAQQNDGVMLGFISVEPQAEQLFIHKLYVDTAQHSRGVGTALLSHASASFSNLPSATLLVNRNNAKAIAYYQRRGFTIVRAVDDHTYGPPKCDYEMSCPLPFAQRKVA